MSGLRAKSNPTKELIPTSEYPRLWDALLAEYRCTIGQGIADGAVARCELPVPGSSTSSGPFASLGLGSGSFDLLYAEFDRRYPGLRDRHSAERLAQARAEAAATAATRLAAGPPLSARLPISASGRATTLEQIQKLAFSPVGAIFAVGFAIGWVKS